MYYLDRFLNVPASPLPEPEGTVKNAEVLLQELPALLDRQQQVNEAGTLVARYLHSGGDPGRLLTVLGNVLLREDREFHTIQTMEVAFRQHALLRGTPAGVHALVAAARYLAAHAPTVRSQEQTYQIARRLSEVSVCMRNPSEEPISQHWKSGIMPVSGLSFFSRFQVGSVLGRMGQEGCFVSFR